LVVKNIFFTLRLDMNNITFLILGVTGDLSLRKLLPAIGQFSTLQQQDTNTHLIGYSRSAMDTTKAETQLGNHSLTSQVYLQGEYNDMTKFDDIFRSLSKDHRLVIYLALPPQVSIPFLTSACPLDPSNIDIIIEKPFGHSLEEAQQIIATSQTCTLTNKIHFFDHYGFKQGLQIPQTIEEILENHIANNDPIEVEIGAKETLGVDDRVGYYDDNGALKDMIQHLITLYNGVRKPLALPFLISQEVTTAAIQTGQYAQYPVASSATDTFFDATISIPQLSKIRFISGKKLDKKQTYIRVTYTNELVIEWVIDPIPYIRITQNGNSEQFELTTLPLLDHTNVFLALIKNDIEKFVSHHNALEGWRIYNSIKQFSLENKILPIKYLAGIYPIKES
jgi:glucose-6-phosphate 1-dehydrogenase